MDWVFIGGVVAIMTLVVTIIGVVVSSKKQKKEISYQIISDTDLLSINKDFKDRVEVHLDQKVVQDPRLLIIKILNSGDIPVIPSDYVEALSISYKVNAKFLTAEITDSEPNDLQKGAFPINHDNKVELPSILLNQGDTLTIKMLVSQAQGDFIVNGRIVGVKKIKNLPYYNKNRIQTASRKELFIYYILFFLGVILFATGVLLYSQVMYTYHVKEGSELKDFTAVITYNLGLFIALAGLTAFVISVTALLYKIVEKIIKWIKKFLKISRNP